MFQNYQQKPSFLTLPMIGILQLKSLSVLSLYNVLEEK